MMALKIWGRQSSSNVQALMWCVGELDLEFERIDAGLHYGINRTPDFLAMNPNGGVPTIIDGDTEALWETGAILRYLCNRYADDDFWPKDIAKRTQVDKWAEWAKINVALKFTAPIFWKVVRTAPSKRDHEAIRDATQTFDTVLEIAEQQLQSQAFLVGETITLADIQFGHVLYRYFDIDIDRQVLPNLRAYYERLKKRPSYQEHVMVSYEELREHD